MPREIILGEQVPTSHLPFSPGVRAGDLVFVSGQASVDQTGEYVEDTFAGELERALHNLTRVLSAAGASLDDVVHMRCLVGDPEQLDEFNRLYPTYFSSPLPARTTTMGGIGRLKFEADAVAYAPRQRASD